MVRIFARQSIDASESEQQSMKLGNMPSNAQRPREVRLRGRSMDVLLKKHRTM